LIFSLQPSIDAPRKGTVQNVVKDLLQKFLFTYYVLINFLQ